jgi:hypothetical protein
LSSRKKNPAAALRSRRIGMEVGGGRNFFNSQARALNFTQALDFYSTDYIESNQSAMSVVFLRSILIALMV